MSGGDASDAVEPLDAGTRDRAGKGLDAPPQDVTARMRQWARRSATDYLSKHSSSVENLRKVMRRRAARRHPEIGKEGAAQLAEEAIGFCREHAFVDDTAYAEMKVRSGVRKGHSRRRIAATLAIKGIDRETSHEALGSADDLAAAAAFARRKKIGPWRKAPLDPDSRRKEAEAFGRNGFSGDTAFKMIGMALEEAEEAMLAGEQNL